jgi:MFS family permease
VVAGASPSTWATSYAVILLCYFLNFALFQFSYPFIPLFLIELGESQSSAIAWTGLGQSIGSLALMLATPVWGVLGDRYGRKSMVVRAMLGGTVTLTLMGLSTQAWHIFGSRVMQGVVGGSSAALLTLAAFALPRTRLGLGMGLMQTAQFVGNSLGPLMGTAAVAYIGFRGTFLAAAGVMATLVVVTLAYVRDQPIAPGHTTGRSLNLLRPMLLVGGIPRLRGTLVATLAFQLSYSLSMTLLPLHLYNVAGPEDAPRSIGVVLAASAAGGAIGATVFGSVTSRVGAARVAECV